MHYYTYCNEGTMIIFIAILLYYIEAQKNEYDEYEF